MDSILTASILVCVALLLVACNAYQAFRTSPRISKQEREDRKRGYRIRFDRDHGDHGRWYKQYWDTNNDWWPHTGDYWYPVVYNYQTQIITCGCFTGTLTEFYLRIQTKPRCPEALEYYMAKYKELETVFNEQTKLKESVEQA